MNRDILKLIEESDLEVVYHNTWSFGTIHYIIARPRKGVRE